MIAFRIDSAGCDESIAEDALAAGLREEGFIRVIVGERLINLDEESLLGNRLAD